ncbi:MAG TPA: hypothetical protein VN493_10815 [Thermoanaerobaculia bacterium]|nr:hypothetical protein [Thermoanaerobaculia bacterium]
MKTFIQIRSTKFPILPGEEEELLNEGTYGKALAEYLQAELTKRGYDAPFVYCEDWGWWVELKAPFTFGVCIYSGPKEDGPVEYVCTDGAQGGRVWSWRKLGFIDTSPFVARLGEDLMAIFQADPDIETTGTTDEFPW